VDAAPLLAEVGRLLHTLHFDAVLIGNAAAALQGAPVTTVDLDTKSKRAAARPRDLAVLQILEQSRARK
jgi:hypothetical protein